MVELSSFLNEERSRDNSVIIIDGSNAVIVLF